MALRPFLLIGVGGSGGKTLRFVRAQLLRRLHAKGVQGMPEAWQFLYFDLPSAQEGSDDDIQEGIPPKLPDTDYHTLVPGGADTPYSNVIDPAVTMGVDGRALVGWRPFPTSVNVPVYKGAGQFRTVGRMVALHQLRTIRSALVSAGHTLATQGVHLELAEVSRKLGYEAAGLTRDDDTMVFVISSLAGGTGSGALLDVCDVLRATHNWGDESIGLLYTAEVFGDVPLMARSGVSGNTIACLAELMAGFWREEVSLSQREFYNRAEMPGASARSGPRYSFLVGTKNSGGVNMGTQVEVYGTIGDAISSFILSSRLQDNFQQFTMGNWQQSATNATLNSPLGRYATAPPPEQPFSGLGVARLTLGRDRFAEYASDRIARATIDVLVRGHLTDFDPDAETEAQRLERIAGDLRQEFLEACGLNERGADHNDVINFLRPPGRTERLREAQAEVRDQIRRAGQAKPRHLAEWAGPIEREVEQLASSFFERAENAPPSLLAGLEGAEMRARAIEWAQLVSRRVIDQTAFLVSLYGFKAIAHLIGTIRIALRDIAVELTGEADQLAGQLRGVRGRIEADLGGGRGDVNGEHENVSSAIYTGVKGLEVGAESITRRMTAELLRDFSESMLAPLEESLAAESVAIAVAEANDNPLAGPIVREWPAAGAVPAKYAPRTNEVQLEDWRQFANVFVDKVGDLNDATTLTATGLDATLLEQQRAWVTEWRGSGGPVKLDAALRKGLGADQELIELSAPWKPNRAELRSPGERAQAAQVTICADIEQHLMHRADQVVFHESTPLGEYARESLAAYLDPERSGVDAQVQSDRMANFEAKFRAMIELAKPLIGVNTGVLSIVHPNLPAQEPPPQFSLIPFASPDEPAHKLVQNLDAQLNLNLGPANFGQSDASEIVAFTQSGTALHPIPLESVIDPVAESWTAAVGNKQHNEFWLHRRTRPLIDFVPLPGPVRRAVIRGYLIGVTLGLLVVERHSAEEEAVVRIFDTDDKAGGWRNFVDEGEPLVTPIGGGSALPRLLEHYCMAIVKRGTSPVNEHLLSYELLVGWGTDPNHTPGRAEYGTLTGPLRKWLAEGQLPDGLDVPPWLASDPADSSPQARAKQVVAVLGDTRQRTMTGADQHLQAAESFQANPLIELQPELEQVISDLIHTIETTELEHEGPDL